MTTRTTLTQEEIISLAQRAAEMTQDHPELREGQALLVALTDSHPLIALALVDTTADPFYDDTRIDAFYTFLQNKIVSSETPL
jgi:hypothetical protein